MRLITDSEHAQIVEALYLAEITRPFGTSDYVSPAIATLQALPALEVVGTTYPAIYSKNTLVRITKDDLGSAKLYATKDKT